MHIFESLSLKFCCEIEFTRLTRSESAEKIAALFETESIPLIDGTYEVQDTSDRTWILEKDDTIKPEKLDEEGNRILASEEYQCKLVTPYLGYSELGVLQGLVTKLLDTGAEINASCVFRCIVRADSFDPRNIRYLCNQIYENQTLLEKALNTYAKRRNKCRPIPDTVIEALNEHKPRTFHDFARIWFEGDSGTACDRVLDLTNLLNGGHEIKFQLFNGALDPDTIKSLIEFSLLLTLNMLDQNSATYESPPNHLCDKEKMLKFAFDDLGTKAGDMFIDLRIHLLKLLPSKQDVDGPQEDNEEDCTPPLIPFPNKDVPDGAFEPISAEEWEKYCQRG